MKAVILCGGSGTRLWPLSTKSTPKQFLPLIHKDETMFQSICLLASEVGATEIIVVMNSQLVDIALSQVNQIQDRLPPVRLVLEPIGRNTAPAIAVASLVANEETPLIVLPSDHTWELQTFKDSITKAVKLAETSDSIVTLGITPTYPETGYGYIQKDGSNIVAFCEKPNAELAQTYLDSGNYLWNSGVFIFRPSVMQKEFERLRPNILTTVENSIHYESEQVIRLDPEIFSGVENISVDYAIMENARSGRVVSHTGLWNDVGSYRALHQIIEPKDENNNYVRGNVRISDTSSSLIINSGDIRVNTLGIDNLIVVVSKDGKDVLITNSAYSQYVNRFK